MLNGMYVVDAVAHGLNHVYENDASPLGRQFVLGAYRGIHSVYQPAEYVQEEQQFLTQKADPERLARIFFGESQTDFVVYHGLPLYGLHKDGGSPLWVGSKMRELWPGRVAALYADVNVWQSLSKILADIDRLSVIPGVVGLKFYPLDHREQGSIFRMDSNAAYAIFERARAKGLRSMAVHKALPQGPTSSEPYRLSDIESPARDFPDLIFEIVHGGYAFMEETELLLHAFHNVVVTLEATTTFLYTQPERFAHSLGRLVRAAGEERVIWATGAEVVHPQPFLEAFERFQMPEALKQRYGYPEITQEMKGKILSGNIARILQLDLPTLARSCEQDEFSRQTERARPWTAIL